MDFFFEGLSSVLAVFEFLHEGGLQGFAILEQGDYLVAGLDDERFHGFGFWAFGGLCEEGLKRFHRLAEPADDAVCSPCCGEVVRKRDVAGGDFFQVIDRLVCRGSENGNLVGA